MAWKCWMIAATGACAFTMMVAGAQSAPLGSAATDFRSSAAAETGFERIDYRRTYRNRLPDVRLRWASWVRLPGARVPLCGASRISVPGCSRARVRDASHIRLQCSSGER